MQGQPLATPLEVRPVAHVEIGFGWHPIGQDNRMLIQFDMVVSDVIGLYLGDAVAIGQAVDRDQDVVGEDRMVRTQP